MRAEGIHRTAGRQQQPPRQQRPRREPGAAGSRNHKDTRRTRNTHNKQNNRIQTRRPELLHHRRQRCRQIDLGLRLRKRLAQPQQKRYYLCECYLIWLRSWRKSLRRRMRYGAYTRQTTTPTFFPCPVSFTTSSSPGALFSASPSFYFVLLTLEKLLQKTSVIWYAGHWVFCLAPPGTSR